LSPLLAKFQPDDSSTRVARAVREGEAVQVVRPGRAPGDWRQLRGLPVVAGGVQGAMFGSRPDHEAIRKLDRDR
jgi:hypothetical protein